MPYNRPEPERIGYARRTAPSWLVASRAVRATECAADVRSYAGRSRYSILLPPPLETGFRRAPGRDTVDTPVLFSYPTLLFLYSKSGYGKESQAGSILE